MRCPHCHTDIALLVEVRLAPTTIRQPNLPLADQTWRPPSTASTGVLTVRCCPVCGFHLANTERSTVPHEERLTAWTLHTVLDLFHHRLAHDGEPLTVAERDALLRQVHHLERQVLTTRPATPRPPRQTHCAAHCRAACPGTQLAGCDLHHPRR